MPAYSGEPGVCNFGLLSVAMSQASCRVLCSTATGDSDFGICRITSPTRASRRLISAISKTEFVPS